VSKFLCLADVHATRRPPSSCTDAYWPDVLGLLRQTVDFARLTDVSAAVWAGDVFHHKAPSRTDHGVMMDLIRVIRSHPCPVLITPGNHDMQHDRADSIDATQPLGVLYLKGALRLEGWCGPDEDDPNVLYGVPWLQDWTREAVAAALEDYRRDSYGCSLVVTHAPIYPPGSEPRHKDAEFTPAGWWADAMGHEGYVFYGHIHEPHGVWRHEGVTFCNNGALSRGSLTEESVARQVGCTTWDDMTGEFEFVPLEPLPAAEVFRLREREQVVTAQAKLDDFLADVGTVTLDVLSVERVMAHIETLTPPVGRDVADLAKELLAAATFEGRC
jgi:DNA repair exonuclease SbcCD nuclease subunit